MRDFVEFKRIFGTTKNPIEKLNPTKISNAYSALFDNDDCIYPDTGATVTCVKTNTRLNNQKPSSGMHIGSCSNHVLSSNTQGELPIQGLPTKARIAHKVDGININLLSVGTVCDQQCVGVFKEKEMFIAHKNDVDIKLTGKPIVTGTRNGDGDLWKIPLPSANELLESDNELHDLWHKNKEWKDEIPISPSELKTMKDEKLLNEVNHLALSAYNQKNAKDLVEFLHACAGYPVIETWIKAIKKGYYSSWPKLDRFKGPQWVAKHLSKSIITTMGHMKATREGIRSTKKKEDETDEIIDDKTELEEPRPHMERTINHQVACGVIATNELKGTISTDLPGRFPFTSDLLNNYIFVMYDFDSNTIQGKAIKARTKSELVRGFEMCYKELKEANVTSVLHRLDNEISNDLIDAIKEKNLKYQTVTAYNHRQNLAERAIQTYKSFLISNLHGIDTDFPAYLWCRLLEQVEL